MYASVRQDLASLFADLERSVAGAQSLPPLSPPQGTGRAYAKFQAAYTAMLDGAAPAPGADAPAAALDAQA